jgi:hypothetical protein
LDTDGCLLFSVVAMSSRALPAIRRSSRIVAFFQLGSARSPF